MLPLSPSRGRKLLVASIGIASVTYGMGCASSQSGNCCAPPPCEQGGYCYDGGTDARIDSTRDTASPPDAVDDSTSSDAAADSNADAGTADEGDGPTESDTDADAGSTDAMADG